VLRIRDGSGALLSHGSVMGKKPQSEILFDADADPGIFLTLEPGSVMENIPDPQHCLHVCSILVPLVRCLQAESKQVEKHSFQ